MARIRRGVAKRVGASSGKPRAWEPSVPKRKPAPKKTKSRLSEQPFAPTDFERRRVLGRGGFGVVYLVEKKLAPDQGRNYAMKVLDKHKLLKGGQRSQARLERDVLRVVRHPFVARLRLSFQTETRLYLLSDFYCGGCLTEFRKDHDVTKEGARFYVVEFCVESNFGRPAPSTRQLDSLVDFHTGRAGISVGVPPRAGRRAPRFETGERARGPRGPRRVV